MAEPLALKYRPKRFADLVGQKASRAVLAKICESRDLPATMIFAGVRGTGKTSVARIVARSVNCENRDRFEPCGVCSSCVAITKETAPFVTEVDAASRGGVANMRELIDEAMFSQGDHYSVFVLDEAHAISGPGFTALLKTLEEPPPNVLFVLVTTEPHKIPETIHARSMLFRFSKITIPDLVSRLMWVVESEELEAEEAALRWIAEAANGGMRDALMMLDQLSRLGGVITTKLCEGVFGQMSVVPLLDALVSGNAAKAVLACEELAASVGDVGSLVDRLIGAVRDDLVARGVGVGTQRTRLSTGDLVALIQNLWKVRVALKGLGADERASVSALVAECVVEARDEPQGEVASEADMEGVFT